MCLPHRNCLHGPGGPQALRRQVDRLGKIQRHVGQTGGLGAQTGPYGRPDVLRPPRAGPLDAGHDAGRSRPQGRRRRRPEDLPPDRSSSPTPRGQHARYVSAEGSPWIEPPYRRCWLGPPPGELQILRRFPTDSSRARRRCRRGPPPRGPQEGVGSIGPEAQGRRRGVLSSAAAGPRPEPETCDIYGGAAGLCCLRHGYLPDEEEYLETARALVESSPVGRAVALAQPPPQRRKPHKGAYEHPPHEHLAVDAQANLAPLRLQTSKPTTATSPPSSPSAT